ncbi:MAG: hypothetical protein FJW96_05535 [Actinobacteria bacterium]|nr:hypothetical protein [Actinomycetota bacterium]
MRRLPHFVALVAVSLAGLALLAVPASGGASAGITQVQVCGAGAFALGDARCATDERAAVRGDTLNCAARVTGLAGSTYTGSFSYRGRSFPTQTGVVPGDGWVYTRLAIRGGDFPAGKWTCRIAAGGSRIVVPFETQGATGPVTSVSACPTSATVVHSGVRACRADRSTRPFPPTSRITCSSVYALARGKAASARLLYDGKATGLALERTLPLPVSTFGMQVTRKGGLPAGSYACEFSLDGKQVATHRFSIAAAAPEDGLRATASR